jgi:nucleoside-diphosphate-sugar epimerase
VFNVGGSEPIAHRALVELLIDVARSGRYRLVEWPPEKKVIDIGSFYADSSLIRHTLGWTPRIGLREGLTRTIEYYRAHMHHYVPAPTTVVSQ